MRQRAVRPRCQRMHGSEIFLVKRPVVPVITKIKTASTMLAKMTVRPTRNSDHLNCFSLGTGLADAPSSPGQDSGTEADLISLKQSPEYNIAGFAASWGIRLQGIIGMAIAFLC